MTRNEIYQELRDRIPALSRREATQRVFEESGVNMLLDQLIELQHVEALQILEEEANGA